MHALFKYFFYGRQGRAEREARHETAAEYYGSYAPTPREGIEEAYHLFMAGDAESSLLLLVKDGDGWIKKGFQDEFLMLCELVPASWESPEELFEVLMLKAKVLKQVGEWGSAEDVLGRCMDISKMLDDARRARVLQAIGAMHYRKGELSGALELFQEAKGLVPDDDPLLMTEVQNGIGVVNWRLAKPDAARKAYEMDLRISEGEGAHTGIARALNNLGILDWQEGRSDNALEKYARAVDAAQRIPDKRLVAMLYSNIADAYKSKGEVREAKRFYERCLELSEDLRFKWQIAEACRGLADIVDDRREEYLTRALRMFERLGAKEDAKAVREMMK
jgi:tetratricopeptide (TPR) repeat protein